MRRHLPHNALACEERVASAEETLPIAHIALVDVIYPKKAKQTPGWFQSGYVCSHEAAVSLFSPLRGFTAFWLIMSSGARSSSPPRLCRSGGAPLRGRQTLLAQVAWSLVHFHTPTLSRTLPSKTSNTVGRGLLVHLTLSRVRERAV